MSAQDDRRNTPTTDQKAALRGTHGRVSASNRLVSSSDPRNTNARTPTVHASSHEAEGSDPLGFLLLLDAEPALGSPQPSPQQNGWWIQDNLDSPRTVSLRVRIDGITSTLQTWSV